MFVDEVQSMWLADPKTQVYYIIHVFKNNFHQIIKNFFIFHFFR
uniref:Uncharacterized protein n=1 Tax=Anguilla anguilla TaxID=7936 RepID=A0A0E9S132_ANGAN